MQRTTYQRDAVVSPATLQQAVLAQNTKGMEEYSQVLFDKEGKFNQAALPAFNEAETKAIKEYMDASTSSTAALKAEESVHAGFDLGFAGGKISGGAWQQKTDDEKINLIRGAVESRNNQWVERHDKGEIDQSTLKAGLYQEGSLMMNEARGKAIDEAPSESHAKAFIQDPEKMKTITKEPEKKDGWREDLM